MVDKGDMIKVDLWLDVCLQTQQLHIIENGKVVHTYPVSTAANGAGELRGSECTPCGRHKIRAKIGAGLPLNAVFKARRPTGEIYTAELGREYPQRDWILTRILWLSGLEPGKNRYGVVDTAWRYIYIHGCPDELMTGKPESHGCIRMYNADMSALFDQVAVNTEVYIHE